MREEEWIFLLVLAAYVVQAVIGGLVAGRRGKSFWFWFAVCFLIIPPMGWIWMLTKTRDEWMP
jgi:hypothetical protein